MINNKYTFPNGKKFIFTIIDDTDDAFLEKIKPVYDILLNNGLKTTKTVWVYPPRDIEVSKGDSLQRQDYLKFIKELINNGFEIGLHNVGSGDYIREEVIDGLNEFNNLLGFYPSLHVNHSYNKDNVYSGSKRFSFPLNFIVKKLYSKYDNFYGDIPGSKFFWGDLHKKYIKYSRNLEIDDINTLKKLPYMPYREKRFEEFSNFWFGSTFAPNQWMFKHMVTKESIDKLEREHGVCILYTHLGYYSQYNKVNEHFKKMIEYIGHKDSGWFIPVGKVLDFLYENKIKKTKGDNIPIAAKKRLELHSLKTRIKYRYFIKKDDYHFKKSNEYEH